MSRLSGGVAVVTGGADGIGRALVLDAARRGMRIAIADIRLDAAVAVAEEVKALGGEAIALACDVSDRASIEDAAAAVATRFGRANLIWANAGLGIAQGFLDARRRNLDWMYQVNVYGTFDTLRGFHALMPETGLRHFGITGSMAGLTASAGASPAYDATKYAVVGIAEGLRAELEGTGIGVTLLCPGLVNTRIWDGARARPERFGGPRALPEETGERWRRDGMDVDFVAAAALDAVENDEFYVVTPEAADRADAIRERSQALLAAVRAPDTRT
ncbi:MAG: SDR family NAD(P)-dependent oxidoreductase [Pseudomonadales bacterium]|jgi:NAD(P)-dependent dehydrogenase (short-subunit alcohol dehydrogenase family)|nr:SDR family NAD(P)-dependent oxidoreductase [Pseudomonadales bacterium]